MEILGLLQELQREFADKKGFFSKRIDIDKCQYLVEQLVLQIPKVVEDAEYIIAHRDSILQNADNVAKHIIHESEKRAEKTLLSAEVIHRAELEAQKIVGTAYAKSDTIAVSTKTHLDNIFFDCEKYLLDILKTLSDNRAKIKGKMSIAKMD
ncbi:MAG: hypothetical protein FWD76_02390 [Firmicutes bacterium]|nr:hypothetical protein [Bacillota bacterium]